MTTQPFQLSIMSAPIAATDRRALSQAWYSALHFGKECAAPLAAAAKATLERSNERATVPPGDRGGERAYANVPTFARRTMHAPRSVVAQGDRRALRSPLARKIERAFLHPARPAQRATLTVDGTNARVHVTLQTTAQGLRLIAVCAPRVKEQVSRALEEARYALATRGITLHSVVEEVS